VKGANGIRTMQDATMPCHDLGPSWWDCLDRPPCQTRLQYHVQPGMGPWTDN